MKGSTGRSEKAAADRVAILLHGGLGLLLGGALGLIAAFEGQIISAPFLAAGGALIGCARGARKGDRLWLNNERQEEIRQSRLSSRLLLVLSILGWSLIAGGIAFDWWLQGGR